MAAAVGVADLSQTLEPEGGHPVDPLDLEEINFSCGIIEKEIDEFDFPDDIFQKVPNEESGPVCADEWIVQDASASGVGPNLSLITQSTAGDEEFHVPDIDDIKQRPNDCVQNEETLGGGNVKSAEDDAHDLGGVTLTVTERNDIYIPEDQDENIPGALLAAQAEWDSVQCVEAGFGDPSAGVTPVEIKTTPLITFNEALLNFQTTDMKSQKKAINMTVHRRGLSAFVNMIFGPPALQKDLGTEKEMAFCMAASSFENENETHFRVLQTIYRTLTGSKFDCSRYGSHFEEIGFQGNDPATDLRGSGMLGLMQILHLLTDPTILPLTRDIYKLSLDETQNFPFCLMGINITRITLQAMREGCLNRDCNKRKQVLAVMNDFYVGTYLHLYEIWKHQHKTISDSGFVLKDVEHYVKKNPKNLMKRLNTYLSKKKDNSVTSVSNKSDPEGYVTIDKL